MMKLGHAWLVVAGCVVVRGANVVDCSPSTQSFTIKTAQDVSDVTTCSTFTGNIVVAADGPESIALDGIDTIWGNIDVENVAQLRSLSSQSLHTVLSFTLNNLPKLSNLSFPALKNFTTIRWLDLPSLGTIELAPGTPESEIQEITVFNTTIKSLDWINYPIGGTLNVTSNANLQSFSIPYSTINAGSTLALSNNAELQAISVSQVNGIYGALQVIENPNLQTLNFENLETIGGYVQMSGAFQNVSMPGLNAVNGALNIDSTGDISSLCNNLQNKTSSHVLNGHYDCTSNVKVNDGSPTTSATTGIQATGTSTSTSTTTPGSNGGGGLATAYKAAIIASAILVPALTLSLIGACIYFRRRMRSKVREIENVQKDETNRDSTVLDKPELSGTGVQFSTKPKELESPDIRQEMGHGMYAHEMDAGETPTEMEASYGNSELNPPITPITPTGSWWSGGSETALLRHELPG